MTVTTVSTLVSDKYMTKVLEEGGNIWFTYWDKNGKMVRDVFGEGINIYPRPDGNGYTVTKIHGHGYEIKRRKTNEGEKTPEQKPTKVEEKTIE